MINHPPRMDPFTEPFFHVKIMIGCWGIPLSLRGISLIPPGVLKKRVHHMILVEAIVEKRSIKDSQIQVGFKFSDREMEVLRLVCGGNTNQEIADRLFVSPYTIKDHVRHIMAKLGVKSRNRIVSAIKNHYEEVR
jgi:DNA-binding CsgD family transcriptional regulator